MAYAAKKAPAQQKVKTKPEPEKDQEQDSKPAQPKQSGPVVRAYTSRISNLHLVSSVEDRQGKYRKGPEVQFQGGFFSTSDPKKIALIENSRKFMVRIFPLNNPEDVKRAQALASDYAKQEAKNYTTGAQSTKDREAKQEVN